MAAIVLQIAAIILFVDFASGFFHWLEDSYGNEKTPFVGPIIVAPNVVHHADPRRFTKSPFWRRNSTCFALALLVFGAGCAAGLFSWQLVFVCALGAACNEIHCYAHRSPRENGRIISALQRLRVLQTPEHHAVHHTDPKNRAYCVLTNVLNPSLDRLETWRRLEGLIKSVSGIAPRPDPTVALWRTRAPQD